jgi:hypothetical protein
MRAQDDTIGNELVRLLPALRIRPAMGQSRMKRPRDLSAELRALSFLQRGSLVRRSGGWRFGTARIPDAIVERILASGKAVQDGDDIHSSDSK